LNWNRYFLFNRTSSFETMSSIEWNDIWHSNKWILFWQVLFAIIKLYGIILYIGESNTWLSNKWILFVIFCPFYSSHALQYLILKKVMHDLVISEYFLPIFCSFYSSHALQYLILKKIIHVWVINEYFLPIFIQQY